MWPECRSLRFFDFVEQGQKKERKSSIVGVILCSSVSCVIAVHGCVSTSGQNYPGGEGPHQALQFHCGVLKKPAQKSTLITACGSPNSTFRAALPPRAFSPAPWAPGTSKIPTGRPGANSAPRRNNLVTRSTTPGLPPLVLPHKSPPEPLPRIRDSNGCVGSDSSCTVCELGSILLALVSENAFTRTPPAFGLGLRHLPNEDSVIPFRRPGGLAILTRNHFGLPLV